MRSPLAVPSDSSARVVPAWGISAIWDREYGAVGAIPSSMRTAPSRAFRTLVASLGDLAGARVLDVGAGCGRQALYCARLGATVHAVDCSPVANEIHAARRARAGLGNTVAITTGRVRISDVPDGRYDVIIDSYATCHLLTAAERLAALDALLDRLSRGGRLYTAGMGDHDSYYRSHIVAVDNGSAIARDPLNAVPKLLQSSSRLAKDDALVGRVIRRATERFTDVVGGHTEERVVHASVLAR